MLNLVATMRHLEVKNETGFVGVNRVIGDSEKMVYTFQSFCGLFHALDDLICEAIRSKSRNPCEVRRRPPAASFSTSLMASRAWSTLRATDPELPQKWEGLTPLFLCPTQTRVD